MTFHDISWVDAPPRFEQKSHLDQLLLWAEANNVNDLTLDSNRPPYGKRAGRYRPLTQRPLDNAEMAIITNAVYKGSATTEARNAPIRVSYNVMKDIRTRVSLRSRVTITSCRSDGADGFSVTIRLLNDRIPHVVDDINIESVLLDAYNFKYGAAYMLGKVESGKTTLQCSLIDYRAAQEYFSQKIIHFGSPIEFNFDHRSNSALITQIEVPRDVPSYAIGLKAAMSQTPDRIVNEEVNDRDTMDMMLDAAVTGVAVEGTLHTDGVAHLLDRVGSFYAGDRDLALARQFAAIETIQVAVFQRLEPGIIDGNPERPSSRRCALREFLVFDQGMRDALLAVQSHQWAGKLRDLLRAHGQPLEAAATKAFDNGLISRLTFDAVLRRTAV